MTKIILKKIDSLLIDLSNLSNCTKLLGILILGVIIFILILKLNIMTPMWSDDYPYSFIWNTNEKVKSLSDIIYSQYQHYQTWGGRVVAHFIAQFLLMIPPLYADILNSLIYVIYLLLMYYHIINNNVHSFKIFCLVFLLTWFFQPIYGETIFWITGSANYLWCTTIILLFLLPYRKFENRALTKSKSFVYSLLMFLLGVLSGCTNENVGICIIIMSLCFIFLFKKKNKNIPIWAICGIIGALVGYSFLMGAPGNYVRLSVADKQEVNLFLYYFKFNLYSFRLFHHIGYLMIFVVLLLILKLYSTKQSRKLFIYNIAIYLIGVLVPVYIMLPSPEFPDRAYFFTVTCAVILFGITYYNLDDKIMPYRYFKNMFFILLAFAFIFDFYISYKRIKIIKTDWDLREQTILEAISDGRDSVIVYPITANCKYVQGDLTGNLNFMSKYYKIHFSSEK